MHSGYWRWKGEDMVEKVLEILVVYYWSSNNDTTILTCSTGDLLLVSCNA
jgi:hypothetical protein